MISTGAPVGVMAVVADLVVPSVLIAAAPADRCGYGDERCGHGGGRCGSGHRRLPAAQFLLGLLGEDGDQPVDLGRIGSEVDLVVGYDLAVRGERPQRCDVGLGTVGDNLGLVVHLGVYRDTVGSRCSDQVRRRLLIGGDGDGAGDSGHLRDATLFDHVLVGRAHSGRVEVRRVGVEVVGRVDLGGNDAFDRLTRPIPHGALEARGRRRLLPGDRGHEGGGAVGG